MRTTLLASILTLASLPAFAAKEVEPSKSSNLGLTSSDSALPAGSVTAIGKFSDGLQSGGLDALVPFASSHGLTVFSNVRGTWDDHAQALVSLGLGARCLVPGHDIILGANLYYDHVDGQLGNAFNQLGLGAELLTKWFDARFNYYLPDNELYLSPVGPGLYRYESGIEGWNAEAGFLIPWVDRFVEMRMFGGRYDYRSRFGSYSSGWKARGEIRWTPGIITDLEWWEDKTLNGGNWVASVRVSLPFEIGNLFRGRNPFAGAAEALRFGAKREFSQRVGETVLRSHRVQTAQSGLFVDSRYLRVVSVASTNASGQQVTQKYLVYTATPSSSSAGSTLRVSNSAGSDTNGTLSAGVLSLSSDSGYVRGNTISGNIVAANNTATNVLINTNTTGGFLQLSGGTTTVNNAGNTGTLTLSGNIGTGALIQNGAGILTVNGATLTLAGGTIGVLGTNNAH